MTLQERFDNIIECIEKLVASGEADIPQALSSETGFNLRLLGDAFQFITDMTIIQYIRKRKLVHALTVRIEQGLSIEQVVSESGFSDAAAFSKACKKVFDLSPSQITEAVLIQHPPLSFDRITSGKAGEQSENDTLIAEKKQETICGITAEQFAGVKQVLEVGALYGLSDEEAESVYRLSRACNITTAQAAEFYEDFKLQMENGSFLGEYDLSEIAELACKYDLSFTEAQIIMGELKHSGYWSIHELPDGFFDIYFCEENDRNGWNVEYICEMAETMRANKLPFSVFSDAVDYADMYGTDIVEAIENFQEYDSDWNDMIHDAMTNGIPEDDTGGFGYRSIWEFSEEELS